MAIAAPFPAARPVDRQRAARRQTLELTGRGRMAVVLVSTAFLFLVVLFSGRLSADAGTSVVDQSVATGSVVVQPGENLWQIARAIAPQADPRETVSLIRSLNGLGDSTVVAGQTVVVPASS